MPHLNTTPTDLQVHAVYVELQKLASSQMRKERSDHTLSATALVHEAYIRLAKSNPQWETQGHFFGIAANVMRQVLIDHARARQAEKRDGDWIKLTLTSAIPEIESQVEEGLDVLQLNTALQALEAIDARQAKIVELRYFGGLSIEETADIMNLSIATIKREWSTAKLFLKRLLHDE
jgi:RNA polymerase sigma-70 factor (ECF subfamily)